ncbi:hypothetical protein BGW80DRAFT_1464756 [Lactifluus volemus]|nr:hypothetical protein BGW80DRAFT_1464756 [Lactifluus volemus]
MEIHSHATAVKADPSYPTFTKRLQALSKTPISEDCVVRMSGNPKRCLEGPVTELDVYKVDDEDPETTQEKIRRVTYRIESLQMQGFIALSWGVAAGDGTRGLYIAGWKTVEDHMRLGTLESHKVFVQETEEIFKNMKELIVAHVPLKRHDA